MFHFLDRSSQFLGPSIRFWIIKNFHGYEFLLGFSLQALLIGARDAAKIKAERRKTLLAAAAVAVRSILTLIEEMPPKEVADAAEGDTKPGVLGIDSPTET